MNDEDHFRFDLHGEIKVRVEKLSGKIPSRFQVKTEPPGALAHLATSDSGVAPPSLTFNTDGTAEFCVEDRENYTAQIEVSKECYESFPGTTGVYQGLLGSLDMNASEGFAYCSRGLGNQPEIMVPLVTLPVTIAGSVMISAELDTGPAPAPAPAANAGVVIYSALEPAQASDATLLTHLFTDASGAFTFTYRPPTGEAYRYFAYAYKGGFARTGLVEAPGSGCLSPVTLNLTFTSLGNSPTPTFSDTPSPTLTPTWTRTFSQTPTGTQTPTPSRTPTLPPDGGPDDPDLDDDPEQDDEQDSCTSPNPLNSYYGERQFQITDLRIPGRGGLDFEFTRVYLGRNHDLAGPLGFGWTHNWDIYLVTEGTGKLVHFSDGILHLLNADGNGGYTGQDGFHYTLTKDSLGVWSLKDTSGRAYVFRDDGKLGKLRDRFGNEIRLVYEEGRLTSFIDSAGRVLSFAPGGQGLLLGFPGGFIEYVLEEGLLLEVSSSSLAYQAFYAYEPDSHRLIRRQDPKGPPGLRHVRYVYDQIGRNTAIYRLTDSGTDAEVRPAVSVQFRDLQQDGGKKVDVTYQGRTQTLSYDAQRRWTGTSVGSDSSTRTWAPNRQGPAVVSDMRGNLTRYSYRSGNRGELSSMTSPLDVQTGYTYDTYGYGVVTRETAYDPASGVTRIRESQVDNLARPETVTENSLGGPATAPRVTLYRYEGGYGEWTSMTDPDGKAFRRRFNPQGLLESYENVSDGLMTSYTYDGLGRLETTTDHASGLVTTYQYADLDKIATVTYRDGFGTSTTSSNYDANGNLIQSTDELNSITEYRYSQDGLERLESEELRDRFGARLYQRTYGYDAFTGLRSRVTLSGTDGLGQAYSSVTNYHYVPSGCGCSAAGQLESVEQPQSSSGVLTTRYEYDPDGRRSAMVSPGNHRTSYHYDAAGRQDRVTYAEGTADQRIERSEYNGFGDRTAVVDGKTQRSTFTYDGHGRLVQENPPSGPPLQYLYTPGGKLERKIDREGKVWEADYDASGRMTEERFPDHTGAPVIHHFTYGRVGQGTSQLLNISDPTGRIVHRYGHRGRLTQTDFLDRERSLSFTYDDAGRLSSRTLSIPGGTSVSESYVRDALGRVTTYTDWNGNAFNYRYDAASQLRQMEIIAQTGNGPRRIVTGRYGYDGANRLLSIDYRRDEAGPLLAKVAYTYDQDGNRTGRTTLGSQASYGYDALGQLTSDANSADSRGSATIVYDAAGNRDTQTFAGNGVVDYDFGNDLNRLVGAQGGGQGTHSFAYNNNGETTQRIVSGSLGVDGTTDYFWDGKGRLGAVDLPGGLSITHAFDYNNHQVGRSVKKSGQITDINKHLYTGNQVIEETSNGQRHALYGLGPGGLDSRTGANGHSMFSLKDGLGSVIALVDENANVIQDYEYSAFGESLSGRDSVNPYRFVGGFGGRTDDATGLVYFWNRWYDPQAGRWLNEDPTRFSGGNNFYNYASNNPALLIDPFGLEAVSLDFFGAIGRYLSGESGVLRIPISELDLSGIPPRNFRQVREEIRKKKQGTTRIVDEMSPELRGNYEYVIGHLRMRLRGDLRVSGACWNFSGEYASFGDWYDFNSLPWGRRSITKELLTRGFDIAAEIVSVGLAEGFFIDITGTKAAKDSGNVSDVK